MTDSEPQTRLANNSGKTATLQTTVEEGPVELKVGLKIFPRTMHSDLLFRSRFFNHGVTLNEQSQNVLRGLDTSAQNSNL